jgi:small subunit ribosomal protein S19
MSRPEMRKKKEFKIRGKQVEELMGIDPEEFLDIMPARVRRTLRRGLTEGQMKLWQKVKKSDANKIVRTHCRDMIILPDFVGKRVAVHNGKEFVQLNIAPEMVGHYLGEFAITRRFIKHGGPGVGATRSSKFLPLK